MSIYTYFIIVVGNITSDTRWYVLHDGRYHNAVCEFKEYFVQLIDKWNINS